jgi:hypothetical protein
MKTFESMYFTAASIVATVRSITLPEGSR